MWLCFWLPLNKTIVWQVQNYAVGFSLFQRAVVKDRQLSSLISVLKGLYMNTSDSQVLPKCEFRVFVKVSQNSNLDVLSLFNLF